KKLILIVGLVAITLLITACGKSDDEKFLEGEWEGTNNSNKIIFKDGKETTITSEGETENSYEIVEDDDDKDIITIETDGKEFNDDFDGFTFYSEFKKDGDKIVYLMSYLENDKTGNYDNQYTVDGNNEMYEKTSSSGFSFWDMIGKLIVLGIVVAVIVKVIDFYKKR
ncbi:TPA: hypothetical protein PQI04_002217, partial [Staphylococcus aureus]|nr:hypothetical protein [Staphylococcus aureus]